mmetsp:Transcript_19413/g.33021  ORF Transcript_19413/g.33021 Transcript_19413/m.33021 type:complete len:104 (+) Transcript_19413:290-601(+)
MKRISAEALLKQVCSIQFLGFQFIVMLCQVLETRLQKSKELNLTPKDQKVIEACIKRWDEDLFANYRQKFDLPLFVNNFLTLNNHGLDRLTTLNIIFLNIDEF